MRIWFDTGHLNADSGAVGGGQVEVKRNDLLADEVENLAKWQGWIVGSTNEKDYTQSLSNRIADATAFGADIFVSIHHDWVGGAQAVIYQNTDDSKEVYGRRLAGFINRRIDKTNDGIPTHGIYADRRGLGILKGKMPSVVIEASRVQDPYVVANMAKWIIQGICDFLGTTYREKPTPSEVVVEETYRYVAGWAENEVGMAKVKAVCDRLNVKFVPQYPAWCFHASLTKTKEIEAVIAAEPRLHRFHGVKVDKDAYLSIGIAK